MKLRIKGDSIRIRLSQNEVTELVKEGEVWSTCHVAKNHLIYGLIKTKEDDMNASFENNKMIIHIPEEHLKEWDVNEIVGFDHTNEDGLYLLVEKDFQCLKPREHEDESNLFPNPQAI